MFELSVYLRIFSRWARSKSDWAGKLDVNHHSKLPHGGYSVQLTEAFPCSVVGLFFHLEGLV